MKNIFVFPCGSEIALEIARSLKDSTHFHLIGGSSVADHGRFVFADIEENLPWESDSNFIPAIHEIVARRNIELIYPAMDSSIVRLKTAESELGCRVVGSELATTEICLSKSKTYHALNRDVRVPALYAPDNVPNYPVFCKPDVGYGSRGAAKINSANELEIHLKKHPASLICEYLDGAEYTVDCFTDRHGELLFCGPRVRSRIMNGISVNTYPVSSHERADFIKIADAINKKIRFRGAWFFQLKRSSSGELVLLEIAARLGGSSALFRGLGVNFAELSIWDALNGDVSIVCNDYPIEMDRALDNRFKLSLNYDEVFIDYDDTVILEKKYYNTDVMKFLYQCKNRGVKISLLSRHKGDIESELKRFSLDVLFDRVIHLQREEKKSDYIKNPNAIYIDDSFAERREVSENCNISVFSVEMIPVLID